MESLKKYNPIFSHPNDLIAFAVHLSFLQTYRLVGLSQEQYLEDIGSVPQGWNRSHELYTFRYVEKNATSSETKPSSKPTESSSTDEKKEEKDQIPPTILVKVLQLEENSLIISAVRSGSDNVIVMDLSVSDHINLDEKITPENTNFDKMFKDLGALTLLIEERITHKVIPSQTSSKTEKEKEKDKEKEKEKDNREIDLIDDFGTYPDYYESNRNRPNPFGGDFGSDLNPIPNGGIGGIGGSGIGGEEMEEDEGMEVMMILTECFCSLNVECVFFQCAVLITISYSFLLPVGANKLSTKKINIDYFTLASINTIDFKKKNKKKEYYRNFISMPHTTLKKDKEKERKK
ncbi:hypothetical protein RFI_24415 [Reticulomyxa filosa]|uniref:PI31 proteasome regulator N-terminal domain-containing protein n=1 Tax=Reticulomyxa filosa TaxID=46433 RepID=X6MH42_RETFI|nr:hypothetical protein RFI_24415 [Reticulomyxa filosa]|eukprot:ETO12961.1 hypothetical protein RFI_24415 [Reticulomyxa filosa]